MMWIGTTGKGPPRPTRVSPTPLWGLDVPVHKNPQEVVGVRADARDTRYGVLREGGKAPQEYPTLRQHAGESKSPGRRLNTLSR
jgi:hypothetical protein